MRANRIAIITPLRTVVRSLRTIVRSYRQFETLFLFKHVQAVSNASISAPIRAAYSLYVGAYRPRLKPFVDHIDYKPVMNFKPDYGKNMVIHQNIMANPAVPNNPFAGSEGRSEGK